MNSLVDFALLNGGYDTSIPSPKKYSNKLGVSFINPSIFYFNEKFYFNTRIINYYKIFSNDNFSLSDNSQLIVNPNPLSSSCNSINVITELGTTNDKEVIVPFYFNTYFNGLEDAKFVIWDGVLYMYGTRLDVIPNNGIIVIYELNEKFEIIRCINAEPIRENAIEKNWMAIPDRPFHFIYDVNNTTIVKVDRNTGKVETVLQNLDNEMRDEELRGCGTICRLDDGYIAIVHSSFSDDEVKYKFKFIRYDNNFNIVKVSDWFVFKNEMCEFCCGMLVKDGILHIGYSVLDCCSYILTIPVDKIDEFWNIKKDKNVFNPSYFYDLALSNEKNFITSIPIFNYVACNTSPFDLRHYECAIRVIAYWIHHNDYLANNFDFFKQLCIKYNTIYPQNCEPYYLLALLYRFENDLETAKSMKKKGDELNSNMKPFFERYLNTDYV